MPTGLLLETDTESIMDKSENKHQLPVTPTLDQMLTPSAQVTLRVSQLRVGENAGLPSRCKALTEGSQDLPEAMNTGLSRKERARSNSWNICRGRGLWEVQGLGDYG